MKMPRRPGLRTKCNDGIDIILENLKILYPNFIKVNPPFTKEEVQIVGEYNYYQGQLKALRQAIDWATPKKDRSPLSTPHHTQLKENLVDSQSDSATNSKEERRWTE